MDSFISVLIQGIVYFSIIGMAYGLVNALAYTPRRRRRHRRRR